MKMWRAWNPASMWSASPIKAACLVAPQLSILRSLSASAEKALSSSGLAILRKRTGFSLSLCKKALQENDGDVSRSELWLNAQAQDRGWAKANQLQHRNASQGLVGLMVQPKCGVMVELNCETDFVAKNTLFAQLLREIVHTQMEHCSAASFRPKLAGGPVAVQHWSKDMLMSMPLANGRSLGDKVALHIGQIGENISLSRAINVVAVEDGVRLAGLTHPPCTDDVDVAHGRYGVILAYRTAAEHDGCSVPSTLKLVTQICQHVIGMNPRSVGNLEDSSTWPQYQATEEHPSGAAMEATTEGDSADPEYESNRKLEMGVNPASSAKELIHQPFLLDSEVLVRELLLESGVRIEHFSRFELGCQEQ